MKSTLASCSMLLALAAGCNSGGSLSTAQVVKANAILGGHYSGPGAYTYNLPPPPPPLPVRGAALPDMYIMSVLLGSPGMSPMLVGLLCEGI